MWEEQRRTGSCFFAIPCSITAVSRGQGTEHDAQSLLTDETKQTRKCESVQACYIVHAEVVGLSAVAAIVGCLAQSSTSN